MSLGAALFCRILTDDGHEGVEVADVKTLLSHVDEELYDARSVFLLHWLKLESTIGNESNSCFTGYALYVQLQPLFFVLGYAEELFMMYTDMCKTGTDIKICELFL